jgi:hypothetical protein
MATTWPLYGTNHPWLAYAGPSSATETTLALDSAYTYASAGDAVGAVFLAPESANLTDFWIKVTAYTGTWASTDGVINVQIREGLNGSNIPGTTLTGSFTITLDGSTTGWIKKSGLSIALTAGTQYFAVIADADGGATNYVTLAVRYTASGVHTVGAFSDLTVTSTNGYSTAGTQNGGQPAFLLKVGTNVIGGGAISSVATSASSTNERGMRFRAPEDCTLIGFVSTSDNVFFNSNISTLKVYADGTSPGGSTLASVTTVSIASGTSPMVDVFVLPAASRVDLTGGTWYRVACDYSSATTTPRKCTVGGSPDSDVLSIALPFGGNAHYIEESAGSWDDTQTSVLSTFGPVLAPKTASASGGGGPLVGGRLVR